MLVIKSIITALSLFSLTSLAAPLAVDVDGELSLRDFDDLDARQYEASLWDRDFDELDARDDAEYESLIARTVTVPSAADLVQHLNVAKDTSLFYSSNDKIPPEGTAKEAKAWAKAHAAAYKILGQLWKVSSYPDQFQNDVAISKDFFNKASQAMAEASSGTVYVMLPPFTKGKETEWYSESVWAKYEWPALQKNANVKTVIRVDSANNQHKIKG